MNKNLLLLALTAALGATSAQAADTGFYIGGSFGQSQISDFSGSDLDREFATLGITSTTTTDDSDSGWKAFAGYKITKNLAVEGSYTNLGEATARTVVTAPVAGTFNSTLEFESWSISAVGILPLNDQFSLFARLGLNVWNLDGSVTGTGSGSTTVTTGDDGADVVYGLGASYNFSQNLSLRGEWERYDFDGSDVDLLSVGLAWAF